MNVTKKRWKTRTTNHVTAPLPPPKKKKQNKTKQRKRQGGELSDKKKVHKTEMDANSKEPGILEKELQGINDV